MYVDNELVLDWNVAVSADRVSTHKIDLAANRKIWAGRTLYAVVIITETFADMTSLVFQVVTASTENLVTNRKIEVMTRPILEAELTAGRAPIIIPIGSADDIPQQYLGMYYDETGSPSAGKVTAFIALDAQTNV